VSRRRRLVSLGAAAAAVAALTVAGLSSTAGATPRSGYLRLAGSAVPFASPGRAIGAVDSSTRLTIQVWMRPGHLAAAQRYATAVSTPGSALFHHYLSPSAYTARFGTSRAAAAAVTKWLRGQGFTGIHADSQRNYVRATGPVKAIDQAFRTTLKNYRASASVNAGPYQLRANSGELSIPRSLSREVLGVTGLSNAAPRLPLMRAPKSPRGSAAKPKVPCSQYYGQHHISGLPKVFGQTSLPTQICGYGPQQMRAAYGMNTSNNGHGQTVSLVELGLAPDMFQTLKDYAAAEHFAAPDPEHYEELSLGNNSCGDPFTVEEQLDVETSYDMAPAANQLVVGGDSCNNGDFGNQGLFDADLVIIDGTVASHHHPLANISSNSWGPGNDLQQGILTSIMHAYLVRAAAQGIGMYFASGDSSGVETPDDPYTILVGGTSLGIGKDNQRLFETGWSSGLSGESHHQWGPAFENGATSGGPSLLWAEPGYQRGVVPKSMASAPGNRGSSRSEPDISADADLYTGFATGMLEPRKGKSPKFVLFPVGGTSMASPLVAGMVADAQQGQRHVFGFTDPVLYRLAGTSAIRDILPSTSRTPGQFRGEACTPSFCGGVNLIRFDDQSYSMAGYLGQVTARGYDNMTGIGTPRGQLFIDALRRMEH
jgi:subtilase family serine protease